MNKKRLPIFDEDDELISALETGGYEPIEDEATEIQRYTQLFKESGNRVKRVNIRMTTRDLEKAQAMALREGIPYATLLTGVLHRYFTGRLKESR